MDMMLLQAARDGDLGKVREILNERKDILNCMNDQGQTPLHLASRNHHAEVVREIINNGADLNAPDKKGRTPLHAAMSLELCVDPENLQVVQLLVDNGADLAKEDEEGVSPITQASRNGRVRVMQWLLDRDPYGYLPANYLPPHERAAAHANMQRLPTGVLTCMLAWVYPAAEVAASIACCLPVWQTCTDPSSTPLLAEEDR